MAPEGRTPVSASPFAGSSKRAGNRSPISPCSRRCMSITAANSRGFSWRSWPVPMRDPRSPEVAAFAAAHRDRVEFFHFLQWEADRQLAAAAEAGRTAGLSIGLYRDLAVGADPNGAEAWADQELVAPDAAIGAPPDMLSRAGQNWGLAPINPMVSAPPAFRAVYRLPARQYASCRCVADRSRHVVEPALLDPERHGGEGGLLCELSVRRAVAARRSRKLPPGLRRSRRGFRHRAPRAFARRCRRRMSCPIASWCSSGARRRHLHRRRATIRRSPRLRRRPMTSRRLQGFWLGRDIAWRRRLGLYPEQMPRPPRRPSARGTAACCSTRSSPRGCWRRKTAANS